jgi:hypothetical protein
MLILPIEVGDPVDLLLDVVAGTFPFGSARAADQLPPDAHFIVRRFMDKSK